ncbi:hypothetical protein SFRURICE_010543 [Spodoptera frugiperda]|nr:hypothetical protein SFRURICE_010543 [Spodoptera frugiperda]
MLSFPLQIQSRETIYYIYKRDYSINNTLKFKECLQNLFWTDVYMDNDANTAFNSFHDLICLFYNLCFPKVRVKINSNNKIKQTWITKGLKLSSKTKRSLRYQYYKNKNRTNKNKYITYSKILQNCIYNAKRNANIKFMNNNKNKCKATWSVIKNEIQNMNIQDIECLQVDNTILTKPAEITSAFNNHFINCIPTQNQNQINSCLNVNSVYIQFNKHYNNKFNFKIDISKIRHVEQTKFLGITLDEYLDWKAQVEYVCNKINKFVYALKKIKHVTSIQTAVMSYRAYVESSLRYGLLTWGNSTEHNRAFIAQKKCIRAIYGIPPDESCKPIFKKLGLLPLPSLYIYEMCMFVKKHQDLFKTAEEVCSRSRRDQYTLVLDELPRCTKYNKNCVAMCVRVYNNLPKTLKELNCRLFKFKLYKWLNENNFYSIKEYLE